MATRGVALTIAYVAWDTVNNVGKTGDVANHTLRWIKDGTSAAPTNAPAEVDATNAPGVYKITLTAAETGASLGVLAGKSSTTGISVIPLTVSFVRLPDVAPAANGGLATVNANNYIAGIQGTKNTLDDIVDLATVLTESYRATGAQGTAAQLLYEIMANIVEFAIVNTVKTARKLDGSTPAKTYTLNDADNPTTITETT